MPDPPTLSQILAVSGYDTRSRTPAQEYTTSGNIDRPVSPPLSSPVPTVQHYDEVPLVQHYDKVPAVQHFDEVPTVQHCDELPTVQHYDKVPAVKHHDEVPTGPRPPSLQTPPTTTVHVVPHLGLDKDSSPTEIEEENKHSHSVSSGYTDSGGNNDFLQEHQELVRKNKLSDVAIRKTDYPNSEALKR